METFSDMAAQWIRENLPHKTGAEIEPQGMAVHDPDEWRDEFHRWVRERCIHREGCDDWAGIGALVIDFGEWLVSHESVPCPHTVFERLLFDAGYYLSNGMVRGVILEADRWAIDGTRGV